MSTPVVAASSIFANLGSAKMRVSANYVRPGHYLMRYDRIKVDQTRKLVPFLAFEMTVVKVLDNDSNRGHRVGEGCCHMLMANNDCFLGNVKAIIANVLGLKPEEIQANHAQEICAADQPLAGMVVEMKARQIIKRDGQPFTEINHYREIPPEELLTTLDAKTQSDFFPGGQLQKLIEGNKAAAAQAVPAA